MKPLHTVNVLIVSVASTLALAAIIIGILIGNDNADRRHTQMLQTCVNAGHIWVRGDCLIPTRSTP